MEFVCFVVEDGRAIHRINRMRRQCARLANGEREKRKENRESRTSITHRSGESSWDRTEKNPHTQICATLINMWLTWKMYLIALSLCRRCVSTLTNTVTSQSIRFEPDSFPCYCGNGDKVCVFDIAQDERCSCFSFSLPKCVCVSLREHKNEEPTTHSHRYLTSKSKASSAHPTQLSASWKFYWSCYCCRYRCRSSCFCFITPIVTHSDNELTNATCTWKWLRNTHRHQRLPISLHILWRYCINKPQRCATQTQPPSVITASRTTLTHRLQELFRASWRRFEHFSTESAAIRKKFIWKFPFETYIDNR